jgi:hypothetical protein
MIELMIIIALICVFTGCSISDAIGAVISLGLVLLVGGVLLFFVIALLA